MIKNDPSRGAVHYVVRSPRNATMNAPRPEGRETSDTYLGEICRAVSGAGTFRVIVCRDGIQWIVQRLTRATGGPRAGEWRAEAYVLTREALLRLWADRTGAVAPELIALPLHFRRVDRRRAQVIRHV